MVFTTKNIVVNWYFWLKTLFEEQEKEKTAAKELFFNQLERVKITTLLLKEIILTFKEIT